MKKLENKAEYLPLSELVKLENNPRTIKKADFEKLKTSIKASCDKNGFIGRNYSTRSKIPELAIKDFFDQAIAYIEGEKL